ncbi:tyrosine-type recombinase/integrase [Caballeronia zhejiangensis]|nr:tyrosine-type recombinase/integrase [Caballeronia zhejiangensis]
MAIKKSDGAWIVDIQPGGRGAKRIRKTCKTLAEAKAFDAWAKTRASESTEWMPEKRDLRKLSTLIETWFAHHGSGLRSGEDTFRRLTAIAVALGDPVADRFTAEMFASYRAARLADGVTPNNLNREHAYMRAVFNELDRLGLWKRANPLAKLRPFKIQETELSYLDKDQIPRLLDALSQARNPHVLLITKVCLSTGSRWSEAEELKLSQVRAGLVQFAKTKSGKVRAVPISPELEQELIDHHRCSGQGERIFGYAWSAFREGIERAGIELPEGQMTHALRHTFASHFMMNGGNILALQRILGHQNLTMTMRYAHLAPEHLQEARLLNPLSLLRYECKPQHM